MALSLKFSVGYLLSMSFFSLRAYLCSHTDRQTISNCYFFKTKCVFAPFFHLLDDSQHRSCYDLGKGWVWHTKPLWCICTTTSLVSTPAFSPPRILYTLAWLAPCYFMPLCFSPEAKFLLLTLSVTWLSCPSKLPSRIAGSRTPVLTPSLTCLVWPPFLRDPTALNFLSYPVSQAPIMVACMSLSHPWFFGPWRWDLVLTSARQHVSRACVWSVSHTFFSFLIQLFSNWAISWLIPLSCSENFYPHSRLSIIFEIDEVAAQMRNLQVSVSGSVKCPSVLLWSVYTWRPHTAQGQAAW